MSEFLYFYLSIPAVENYLKATFVKWWIAAIKGLKGYIKKSSIFFFFRMMVLVWDLKQMNVGYSIIITTVIITQHKLLIFFMNE